MAGSSDALDLLRPGENLFSVEDKNFLGLFLGLDVAASVNFTSPLSFSAASTSLASMMTGG